MLCCAGTGAVQNRCAAQGVLGSHGHEECLGAVLGKFSDSSLRSFSRVDGQMGVRTVGSRS